MTAQQYNRIRFLLFVRSVIFDRFVELEEKKVAHLASNLPSLQNIIDLDEMSRAIQERGRNGFPLCSACSSKSECERIDSRRVETDG